MPIQKFTRIIRDCAAQSGSSRSEIDGDDGELAALFIRMWSLASGRAVPRDVPPDQLTEEELIGFWADDFSRPGGRHAAHDPEAPAW
jgi:hypothetical protein